MPNKNIFKILSTRPLRNELIHSAAFKGVQVDTKTFINTEPILAADVVAAIKNYGSESLVAVFTSMNAVEAVSSQLSTVPNWQIFTLGGITRELIVQFFGEDKILATGKNAGNLTEKIVLTEGIKKVVFFCGDQRLDELPEILKVNGIEVTDLIVYKTILTPEIITDNYDGVAFFSPSAVHSFFSANTIPLNTIIFSIGKTTTATIRTYVANDVITSEWPGKEQLIDMAVAYFSK